MPATQRAILLMLLWIDLLLLAAPEESTDLGLCLLRCRRFLRSLLLLLLLLLLLRRILLLLLLLLRRILLLLLLWGWLLLGRVAGGTLLLLLLLYRVALLRRWGWVRADDPPSRLHNERDFHASNSTHKHAKYVVQGARAQRQRCARVARHGTARQTWRTRRTFLSMPAASAIPALNVG